MATYEYNPTGSSTTSFIIGDDEYTSIPDDYTGIVLSTKKAFTQEVLDVTLPDMFNELELDYSYNPYDNSITISSRKSNLSSSADNILTDLTQSSVDLSNVYTRDNNPTYFDENQFYNHMYEISAVINSNFTDTQKSNELQKILMSESNYDYKKTSIGNASDSTNNIIESSFFGFTIDKPKASTVKNYGLQKSIYYHTSSLLDLGTYSIERFINGVKYGNTISDTLASTLEYEQACRSSFDSLRSICNSNNLLDSYVIPVLPPIPPDKRIPTTCCLLVEIYPDLYKYP